MREYITHPIRSNYPFYAITSVVLIASMLILGGSSGTVHAEKPGCCGTKRLFADI